MNKYAQIATIAIEYINKGLSAEQAWEKSSCEIFTRGSASQVKGCPKNAFLGLFSNDNKINHNKNALYARKALSILKENPNKRFSQKELWSLVTDEPKTHNSQMDVVFALWNKHLIK